MKLLVPTIVASGLLLTAGFAQDETPPAPSEDQRMRALESEVAALKTELAERSTQLETVTRYLAGEKARGDALLGVFDQSEEMGFTAGINFRSREVLLAGLRAYVRGAQQGLPTPPPVEEEAPVARGGKRGR